MCGFYPLYHLHFNPRSREGSDIAVIATDATPTQFQSTLPRRERHRDRAGKVAAANISIHAPRRSD